MGKAILLNDIVHADRCAEDGTAKDALLLSTSSSIDIHLREAYGLESRCLSRYLDEGLPSRRKEAASARVDALLTKADDALAPELSLDTGPRMRFFTPLYAYQAKLRILAYDLLAEALRAAVEKHGIDEFVATDFVFDSFLVSATTVSDFFHAALPEIKLTPLAPSARRRPTSAAAGRLKRLLSMSPRTLAAKIRGRWRKMSRPPSSPGGATVLLFDDLYELEFLLGGIEGISFVLREFSSDPAAADRPGDAEWTAAVSRLLDGFAAEETSAPAKLLLKDLKEDFTASFPRYAGELRSLGRLLSESRIALGVWGLPPVGGERALAAEFLRASGVPVVGAQHGCLYGDCYEPWHFDCDFDRCDDYITYGFDRGDLERLYPDREPRGRIRPCGKVKVFRPGPQAERIDLLFPLSNTISILEGGLTRTPPHELTARQERLLEYLDSVEGVRIVVKPFPTADAWNCSLLPVLKRLRRVSVVYGIPLGEYLSSHAPRAVLMEIPSQPLYEVLPLDTEIFLMNDTIHPYEAGAFELLNRRVHFSKDIEETVSRLGAFFLGTLAPKRDDSFLDHYVLRPDPEGAIAGLIRELAAGRGGEGR